MTRRARPGPRTALSVVTAVWILWWTAFTVIFVIVAISEGVSDEPDDGDGVLGGIVLAVLTAMLAGAGVVVARVRRGRGSQPAPVAPAAPLPAPPAPRGYWLPGRKSAARAPMQRLAEAETALRDLMAQLSGSAAGPSVSQDVVDDASRIATETAGRLRAIAAKVEAIEAAIEQAPPIQRAGLEDGALSLLGHLDRGLDGYRELIAAAGHLVLAGTQNPVPDELVEATDHLAGLAAALRELSGGQ